MSGGRVPDLHASRKLSRWIPASLPAGDLIPAPFPAGRWIPASLPAAKATLTRSLCVMHEHHLGHAIGIVAADRPILRGVGRNLRERFGSLARPGRPVG